eukprot:TRINITY_DN633_c2_g1_i1.p1 TRINITY_DN633_c2_g1~~TRINITY_DN633_c2_g1_i1.p1  ORF type:complete len:625 (+),score=294.01 TRINITY_DN633_c2_g1_i1:39-1913(+)
MCKSKGSQGGMWAELCTEFREYHKNSLNVLLHLVTTPMGWVAMMRLADSLSGGAVRPEYIAAAHTLIVFLTASFAPAVGTLLINAFAAYLAHSLVLPFDSELPYGTVALMVAGYVLQDVAHFITGEPTFQSSYSDPLKFAKHTFYLLPLCVDSFLALRRSPFYWMVPRDTTIAAHINDKKSLDTMRNWVLETKPNKDTTTHWWYHDLKGSEKKAFDDLANAKEIKSAFAGVWDTQAYNVDVVHGMNEVYVASPTALQSSDKVFLMDHIDGPWILWPFCTVYRVLAAINENTIVTTHLKTCRRESMLTSGDVLGFDFNREIHRVSFDQSKVYDEQRITLKLHYVVYPKVLRPFGLLLAYVTTQYDIIARNLFLYTIKPTTFMQKLSARVGVLTTTFFVEQFEFYVGLHNVMKTAAILAGCALATSTGLLQAVLGDVLHLDSLVTAVSGSDFSFDSITTGGLMLACTSYIHYLTYISTFYYRSDVNYGRLLRDCMFWKSIAYAQMLFYYAQCDLNIASVAMACTGQALAASATAAIGMDRTYFGAELDIVGPKWISAFPYNCIPHPMILGAAICLSGLYLNEGFRTAYPLLVPVHVVLYVIHATQEHLNIHDKEWRKLQRNKPHTV